MAAKLVEILITATVPDDRPELGKEVLRLARDPTVDIVTMMRELGLEDAAWTRRIYRTRRPNLPRRKAVITQQKGVFDAERRRGC